MSVKILVVDDEVLLQSLMQQRFRYRIQKGEYIFRFALSGRQALAIAREEPDIAVALLDINMPEMDGLALLEKLSEALPTARSVMVSAYGDLTNIRKAMNRGAFDFVMKPIDFQDLEATIDKTALHVGQLREAIRLQSVAEIKARFFDNITHEFRTPLSLIIAPVDLMLQSQQYDAATKQSLDLIRRNAWGLLGLINQLLDLARLETDQFEVYKTNGDAISFLKNLIETIRPLAEHKQIIISFLSGYQAYDTAFDAEKWEKIVMNLLSNAIKFTSKNGSILVECAIEPDAIQVMVSDTGVGIPAEHLPYIFDRFYQVDRSLNRKYPGSGIGLSLAYELTRVLGGSLSVESDPGTGTKFILKLPLYEPVENELIEEITNQFSVTDFGTPLLVHNQESKRTDNRPLLLIIDDHQELRTFISGALADDYQILQAADGQEGLEITQRELPDIVISDVMMPGLDGYQYTRNLKTNPVTDHIAVILLTAKSTQDNKLEGLILGADDYILKPFDISELKLRLQNITQRQLRLREHYYYQFNTEMLAGQKVGEESNSQPMESKFVSKLYNTIELHLDDPQLGPEMLADEVAMSIRTLTRKLNALAGISPARLIRTYRLRRATEMLRNGCSVAEAAFGVGYDNPSYFATAFKDQYQQTPSEYLRGNQG